MTAPSRPRRGPVAGQVASVEEIPGAEKVWLARVDVGTEQFLRIVFGGLHPISPGDVVPVAPPGSWVPGPRGNRRDPVKMRARNFRGHRSEGMLCSLRELGWARFRAGRLAWETQDHVAVLSDVLRPGEPLPGPTRWRDVVVHPSPSDFDPNTAELSLTEIRADLDGH